MWEKGERYIIHMIYENEFQGGSFYTHSTLVCLFITLATDHGILESFGANISLNYHLGSKKLAMWVFSRDKKGLSSAIIKRAKKQRYMEG